MMAWCRLVLVVGLVLAGTFGVALAGPGAAESAARTAYDRDDFPAAVALAEAALTTSPRDPSPLLILASVAAHHRDLKALAELVDRARRLDARGSVAAAIEADLLFIQGRGDEARAALERACDADPQDAGLRLDLAGLLAATGEGSRAVAIVSELEGLGPPRTTEDAVTLATVLALLPGGAPRALTVIRDWRRQAGDGAQVLLAEGLIQLRLGEPGRAVATLAAAFERNPGLLNEALMLAPLLAGMGHAATALRVVERASAAVPGSAEAAAAIVSLRSRLAAEESLEVHRFPRVILRTPAGCSPGTVLSVNLQVRTALSRVESWFGASLGQINVTVLAATGVAAPAYYDAVQDRVVVAALAAAGDSPWGLVPVLRHELGHLALFRVAVAAGLDRWSLGLPLWFVEGLAECAAGRGQEARWELPEPPMSEEDLLLGLSLAAVGRPGSRAAYAQAAVMVDRLVARLAPTERRDAVVRLAQALAGTGDLDRALGSVFGLDRSALLAAVRLASSSADGISGRNDGRRSPAEPAQTPGGRKEGSE